MLNLTALDFFAIAIATWRLSHMLRYESGPRKVFAHIRDLTRSWTWIDFDCQRCTSVWVAALMVAAMLTPYAWLVWILAVSGLALMLGAYTGLDFIHQGEND